MQTAQDLRKIILILLSLTMIACGLLRPSPEITNLQSTIDALTSQLEPITEDSQPAAQTPMPTIPIEIETTPEVTSTESPIENALEYINQYGGSTTTVAVKGNYAYMGQGPRMVVLDISNPTSPVFISDSEPLPGLVMGVEVEGDYAYVTTMYSGLNVFDISKADQPRLVSKVEPKHAGCGPLTLNDGIAFIACNPSGLFVVDISDPISPTILTSDTIRGTMISIARLNEFIYLVDVTKGIVIVDISDPRSPQQVGFFADETIPSLGGAFTHSIDMCQNDLCLAVANHGFVILDLADPVNPTIKASITQFWSSGIITDDRFAYLVDDIEGVRIYDIYDPSNPQQVGLVPTSIGGFEFSVEEITERNITIAEDILYIPDQSYGLTIVDINDPSQPIRVGEYMTPVPDMIMDIKVVGDYAYAVNRFSGFRVLNIANLDNIEEIFFDDERKFLTLQIGLSIEVIGNHAYIADANYPLLIHDISDPYQPKQVGGVDGGPAWDGAFDLAISGNFAYLSGQAGNHAIYPGSGIWVIDISDPTNPIPINFLDLPNEKWSLSIHSTVLFALDGSPDWQEPEPMSLRIIDISNPAQPALMNSLPMPGLMPLSPSGIQVSGDWLYLGLGMSGLKLFDIRDPYNPVETPLSSTSWRSPYAHKLAVEGSRLIMNGNMAYDISDPTSPNLLGVAYEAMDSWNAYLTENLLFITTKLTGIYVYRIN